MTDFEKMATKLRESPYTEGRHFDVWEWESGCKTIEMRPSTLTDEWISFDYDKNGNLTDIY